MKRLISLILVCVIAMCALMACSCNNSSKDTISAEEQLKLAKTTPLGKYPETISYTLGKQISVNNSNMPEGDTYENNAYTRYLLEKLNIKNINAFEAMDEEYDTEVSMAVSMEDIPDIMVVNNYEDLVDLVEKGLVADLTDSYEKCASDTIKDIYESYGSELLDGVTFGGKIMAIPETNIAEGPNLVWLRKDWMDKLGLQPPKNIADVEYIIARFLEADKNRVGLVTCVSLCGESGYSSQYLTDLIFASHGAYPKHWIKNEQGEIVYGSIQPEAKEALVHLRKMYNNGILDRNFLFRSTHDIIELIEEGRCGSFFGPWWTPNNPLMSAMLKSEEADWQPYLIETNDDGNTYYHSTNPTSYKYVVVSKDFEFPELAWKIISVLFDHARYEDKKGAVEIEEYDKNAVDPTARPLVINVDYRNALERCYNNIKAVFDGKKDIDDLNELEKSYTEQCMKYVENGEEATIEQWAAYTSRMSACSLISKKSVVEVKAMFFDDTETMEKLWWRLKELESETYLQIITGKLNIDAFDDFMKEWKQNGGETITEEIRKELKNKEK